jgi:serine/threonine protein kinase
VHRDVKPSNILLAQNDFAYLIDFGIARGVDETGLTKAGATIGTWSYMAPERFNGGEIEPSSDIYALACVLYQCLTGELPFPGTTLEQVAIGHIATPPPRPSAECLTVPTELDEVVATGLAKQPTERYHSTVEMAVAARDAITDSGRQPHPLPLRPPPSGSVPGLQISHHSAPTRPPLAVSRNAATVAPPFYAPPPPPPATAPSPSPKPPRRRRRILIGALAAVALLVVAGAVIAGVKLTRHHNPVATTPPATAHPATGGQFAGTYRADFGPGTDLEGKPVANGGQRLTYGAFARCVAQAVAWRRHQSLVAAG